MRIKSIIAEGTLGTKMTFGCEPQMTKDFANHINDLVDSQCDGGRSHLSFMAKDGNLVVNGVPNLPEKVFFDGLQSFLNEIATKLDGELLSAESSHREFVEKLSEISGLPID